METSADGTNRPPDGASGGRAAAILVGGVAAGAILVLAIGTLWRGSAGEPARAPRRAGEIHALGLSEPIEVVRDGRGVPHVRAVSERDAWFGLGLAHAQDRTGQLLWLRRQAQGRTAEVIGLPGLPADRWSRTLGFVALGRASLERLPREHRALIRAYAAGVNAHLTTLTMPEGQAAEAPWQAEDSLSLLALHAFALADSTAESLTLAEVIRRLGAIDARPYFPPQVGFAAIPADRERNSAAAPARGPRTAAVVAPLRRALGLFGRSVGSSAWIVAGRYARAGRPLLAADAHFAPRRPAHLYEAHLRGGPVDVAGATLPGIPAFWIGFNPDLTWAATAVPVVTVDLFMEPLRGEGTDASYHDGRRWRPLEVGVESIRVAGGEPESIVVRRTSRGPLVHHLLGETQPLSLGWSGARGRPAARGLIELVRARNVEEAREALVRHVAPVAAFALADREGAAGIQIAGAVPDRELPSGLVPVPARDPGYVWSRLLDAADLPYRKLSRQRAWLVVSDEPISRGESGLEVLWRPGHRTARIEALLQDTADLGPMDESSLGRLQRDVGSRAGRRVVDRVLDLAGPLDDLGREAREVAGWLASWDARGEVGSRPAAAYHVLLRRLLHEILADPLGSELRDRYLALPRIDQATLAIALLTPGSEDGVLPAEWNRPERLRALVRRTLRETWIALGVDLGPNREKWTWGRLHPVRFQPLTSWVPPLLGHGFGSPLGPHPYGGDESTVQVAEVASDDPFETAVAATYRFVADAGDLDQALTSLAPGQTEAPGDAHSSDGVSAWLEGRLRLLSTSDPVIEDGPVMRLRVLPAEVD